jgi:hypothetical protein
VLPRKENKMKTKKMLVGLLLVLGIVGVSMTNAFAVEATYTCTINRIGGYTESGGYMYVYLTSSGNFTNRSFRIPEGRLNQVMATLLTAASNGSSVVVRADADLDIASQRLLRSVFMLVD